MMEDCKPWSAAIHRRFPSSRSDLRAAARWLCRVGIAHREFMVG
ncbi:MAG TPA: hypothetical protein VF278_21755 [Pirellulales bacterium]